jgi:hypothetical protein
MSIVVKKAYKVSCRLCSVPGSSSPPIIPYHPVIVPLSQGRPPSSQGRPSLSFYNLIVPSFLLDTFSVLVGISWIFDHRAGGRPCQSYT